MTLLILIAIASLLAVCVGLLLLALRETSGGSGILLLLRRSRQPASRKQVLSSGRKAVDDPQPEVVLQPTDVPGEFLAFGRPEAVDRIGRPLTEVPKALTRVAASSSAGFNGLVDAARLTGRLVVVDEQTAAALRSGNLMRDSAGKAVAAIQGKGKRIQALTRISEGGTRMVRVGSAGANIMSAIAMQAQLARIEKQMAALSEGIDAARWHLDAGRRAALLAVERTVAEVYDAADASGELSATLWSQVDHLAYQAHENRAFAELQLVRSVEELEKLAGQSVKQRRVRVQEAVDAISNAVDVLMRADRAQVQFAALRLWRLIETHDASIGGHTQRLAEAIEGQRTCLQPIPAELTMILDRLDDLSRFEVITNPFEQRQLEKNVEKARRCVGRLVELLGLGVHDAQKELESSSSPEVDAERFERDV